MEGQNVNLGWKKKLGGKMLINIINFKLGGKLFNCLFQLAIPQLLPGAQFPYSFSTGQPIPGYYIPQPIAAAQSSYLQVSAHTTLN